ncbi:MAG: RHS repeat-associated core domain-containing protein [Planctomycetes bacterium]|nr:RHS repeat-associated core domain-containing protein [Planctomycetota bacterium]
MIPCHRIPVGNVERVVTEVVDPEPGQPKYSATRMVYAINGTAVSYVMGEVWEADGSGYDITYGREFRYDGARQRYLNRELDPVALLSGTITEKENGDTRWSDYDGDEVYADFTIDGSTATVQTCYEPGVARSDDPLNPSGTAYYHTNHLGTTRLMSGASGLPFGESLYSAFGELVSGTNHRYGYVGAHGYQTHNDFPFMHVGARYYDPATGRFLQRDPIGIAAGMNVYAYVHNGPTICIDPDGLRYRPPRATGPADKGFTDGFWSKVHYSAGWGAGKAGMSFWATMCAAIGWELWEPSHWPFEFKESKLNQLGDIFVAGKGWVDAHLPLRAVPH